MSSKTSTAAALVLLVVISPAAAQGPEQGARHRACMEMVEKNPQGAFEDALAWAGLGGGMAARHCAAAALMELKQYAEAARRFEELALDTMTETRFKAAILGHAAQARLLEGDYPRAEGLLTQALELEPLDGELFIDRAQARAAMGLYAEAMADLDQAIELGAANPDAYVFRASANRFLGQLDDALSDAAKALAMDGGHPEGLLERGIIRRLKGDDGGARNDWMEILRTAPDTPAADAARANIEKMDVKITPQ